MDMFCFLLLRAGHKRFSKASTYHHTYIGWLTKMKKVSEVLKQSVFPASICTSLKPWNQQYQVFAISTDPCLSEWQPCW